MESESTDRLRRAIDGAQDLAPRPEFVAKLRADLAGAAAAAPGRTMPKWVPWLALAASVLVAAGVGARLYFGGDALARLAVGDHRNCAVKFTLAERPIGLDEAAVRYGPMFRVAQRVPAGDIQTPSGLAHILERHSCVYGGRRFAHVVMRYQGSLVSMLIATEGSSRIASDAYIDGMNLVAFRAGQQDVYFTGDAPMAALTDLMNAVSAPLRSELAAL
jgi:hypothetical protein